MEAGRLDVRPDRHNPETRLTPFGLATARERRANGREDTQPHGRTGDLIVRTLTLAALAALLACAGTNVVGRAAVSAPTPKRWHAPRWWLPQAVCIHQHEGAWNSVGYVAGKATYGGGMQFLVGTWQSVGGRERSVFSIARTSPREQLYRAWLVYLRDGHSWREWSTARACGLR